MTLNQHNNEINIQLARLARFQDNVRHSDYARLEDYTKILLETIRAAKAEVFHLS